MTIPAIIGLILIGIPILGSVYILSPINPFNGKGPEAGAGGILVLVTLITLGLAGLITLATLGIITSIQ